MNKLADYAVGFGPLQIRMYQQTFKRTARCTHIHVEINHKREEERQQDVVEPVIFATMLEICALKKNYLPAPNLCNTSAIR